MCQSISVCLKLNRSRGPLSVVIINCFSKIGPLFRMLICKPINVMHFKIGAMVDNN